MSNKADVVNKIELVVKHYNMVIDNIPRLPKFIQTAEFKQVFIKIDLLVNILMMLIENDLCESNLVKFLNETYKFRLYFLDKIKRTAIINEIIEPFEELAEFLSTDYNKDWF